MVPKGWQHCKLGSLISLEYGKSLPTSERNNGRYFVYGSNGIIGSHDKAIVKGPGITIGRKGSVGSVVWAENDFWPIDTTYFVKPLRDFNLKWLYLLLTYKKLERLNEATGIPGLNRQYVLNLFVEIPPRPEQEEIVTLFSAWDKAIEKTIGLIQAKTEFKQALMQKLLTGNLRFKEFLKKPFHKTELGEFLIPTPRPVSRPNSSYTALGIRSHGKGTFLKTIENPETVMMDTLYEVKENDLIVNITFAWEGAIAIVKKSDEGALVSHRFPTYTFNQEVVIPEYFRHIILTKRFVHELGLVSPGGAGRNRVMSKTDLLNIVVSVPSVDEQRRIAAVLNGIDKEIELLEKTLECLKNQKKDLMQKLLTGKIRVKV